MINCQESLVTDQKKTILFIGQLGQWGTMYLLSYSAAGQLTPDGQIIEILLR